MSSASPFFVQNFLSATEAAILATWIRQNYQQPFFKNAGMRGNRVTTRYSFEGFKFPEISFAVRDRLNQVFSGFGATAAPFKDGMVASCAHPGDTCYQHTDPVWKDDCFTVHCNVIVSAPDSGGEAVIDGRTFPMPERDLLCYPVSVLPHETLLVKGFNPRLMWIFAFCVPATADWAALSLAVSQIPSMTPEGVSPLSMAQPVCK